LGDLAYLTELLFGMCGSQVGIRFLHLIYLKRNLLVLVVQSTSLLAVCVCNTEKFASRKKREPLVKYPFIEQHLEDSGSKATLFEAQNMSSVSSWSERVGQERPTPPRQEQSTAPLILGADLLVANSMQSVSS